MADNIMDSIKVVSKGDICFHVLKTGDIRKLSCGDIMINQLLGNHIDGMAENLFLRVKSGENYLVHPLMGKYSGSEFSVSENQIVYNGKFEGIQYSVYITLANEKWFYDIFLENEQAEKTVDIVYGQDIGLATQGHVQSNEAYNSQYIDHKSFDTENGYVVCSRQNQRQSTGFPFLQQGSLGKARAFSTDGYPFFGLSYKFTNKIEELQKETLNNRVYQYEFAYTALLSEEIQLDKKAHTTFYCVFKPSIETAVEKPVDIEEILKEHSKISFEKTTNVEPTFQTDIDVNNTLCSEKLTEEEINSFYPKKRHEEKNDGKLLSFFTDTFEHIVISEKENYVERSHGHIIITGENDFVKDDILTSTNYIYGVFSSQIALGNTSFNKLLSNCRNGLNISKVSGLRIMLKVDGEYRLLTMPAVYELGFNYAKWIYKFGNEIIEVKSYTMLDRPLLNLEVKSHTGKKHDFLVYAQMCSSPAEYAAPVAIERKGKELFTKHHKSSMSAGVYPDMEFVMRLDCDFEQFDDSRFYPEMGTMNEPMMVLEIKDSECFNFMTEGRIDGKAIPDTGRSFEEEVTLYREWLQNGINNFNLSIDTENVLLKENIEKFNDTSLWYSHNARIHYSSPHGLEQYGGAAWGTRDVCQGPFEYFIAVQNNESAVDILEKVFSHQYIEDGSWPQWYMFDKYYRTQHHESHGDVIVWPLKALAHYITATGDLSILEKEVPYTTKDGYCFTEEKENIFDHAKKLIDNITSGFIDGTSLSRYGGGDWDDTLQPANSALCNHMSSGWTVTLTYQAFREFSKVTADYDEKYSSYVNSLADDIQKDYHKYIIKDGVTAGFVLFEEDDVKYFLHPRDKETGLKYRLLPMTRSMIAEMFTADEVKEHYSIIKEHLYHTDGVRLMNTTCQYRGGVNTYFMRAETASNFGREIGLQYVHAHIRFIEAMAKIGNTTDAWNGLLQINPILIGNVVPNASRCQSNCYFSSSDGAFDNRYEAMKGFDALRTGDVPVKAGWRIYSSGSGIYMNQLISQFLGLRRKGKDIIIDPALPKELNGLEFHYKINGKPVRIKYWVKSGCGVDKVVIDGKEIDFSTYEQLYRKGGAIFSSDLVKENSDIEVYTS